MRRQGDRALSTDGAATTLLQTPRGGESKQVLRDYRSDYESHVRAPAGTSFSHRAPGPEGCIPLLNEDRKVVFFGPLAKLLFVCKRQIGNSKEIGTLST